MNKKPNKIVMEDKLENMPAGSEWAYHAGRAIVDVLNQPHELPDDTAGKEGVDSVALAVVCSAVTDVLNSQPEEHRSRMLIGILLAIAHCTKVPILEAGFALHTANEQHKERVKGEMDRIGKALHGHTPEALIAALKAMAGKHSKVEVIDLSDEEPPVMH